MILGIGLLWLIEARLLSLWKVVAVFLVVGVGYLLLSPSTTPSMTYSLFLFILAFPLCSIAFESVAFELKNPVSRLEYSLGLMLSYLVVFLIPLVPFVLTKNFLSAVLTVVSGVSAGLFFGSVGVGVKRSTLLPILFLLTFLTLFRLNPILSLWNPLLSSYHGVLYQLMSIGLYSLLYLVVMKKREWRD
ncbi:hypothetical protein [Thermococcus sp.]